MVVTGCQLDSGVAERVAVVTDSAACLPAQLIREHQITVVPLRVLAGGLVADDDDAGLPAALQDAVRRGGRLTTARPAPETFETAYRQVARAGAVAVVSVHLSGQLSGTINSAELAAARAPVPVRVVDSRSIGMGLGLVVLAAATAAAAGLSVDNVAAAAEQCVTGTGSFFALDSAEALLSGGRLVVAPGGVVPGPAAPPHQRPAALVSRPLLEIRAGRITVLERVRTRSAASARLAELAVGFAGGRVVDIAVQHTSSAGRAAELAARLTELIPLARHVYLAGAGAAIRAHTGLGMLGVALAPGPAATPSAAGQPGPRG